MTKQCHDSRSTVSVALCTCNGARYIREQLQSIVSQSHVPSEVVVSDDDSTDETVRICREVAADTAVPFRILSNVPRLGLKKNFERAISATAGGIVFLSDQDDVWFPDRVERMVNCLLETPKTGLVYCDASIVDERLQPTGQTIFQSRPQLRQPETWNGSRLVRGLQTKGCTLAFRRWLLPLIVPLPETWDYDYWISFLAASVSRVRCLAVPLMYHRRHAANTSVDLSLQPAIARNLARARWLRGESGYASDVLRWKAAVERLELTTGLVDAVRIDEEKLTMSLAWARQALDFSKTRYAARNLHPISRSARVLHCVLRGDYHRYGAGLGSATRDVLCR